MFDAGKKIEVERGFVEAANDDDLAFFLDLRATIEAHALVEVDTQANYDLNPQVYFNPYVLVAHISNSVVKTLIHDVREAISTLSDAIARDNDVDKRRVSYNLIYLSLYMYSHPTSNVRHSVSSSCLSFTEQWKLW